MKQAEASELGSIWLQASIGAHSFISPSYWQDNLEAMVTKYIPNSQTYVYEADGKIEGFVSLVNSSHIAAIFVRPEMQGKGIGGKLMKFVMNDHKELTLTVYKKNKKSVDFYMRQGFVCETETIDTETREPEITMKWVSSDHS